MLGRVLGSVGGFLGGLAAPAPSQGVPVGALLISAIPVTINGFNIVIGG